MGRLLTDYLWHEFVHMYLAGIMVAGFIVAGVYASGWLRGRRDRYHRVGLVVPHLAVQARRLRGPRADHQGTDLTARTRYGAGT